ncbi:hypothetical protein LL974_03855 [Xanthomonas campestris pv. cannae]|nr:hypothetical protein [Xanthomonas campestris pv. cannae]
MENTQTIDLCRLCKIRPTKEDSHILPKFVGKKAKKVWRGRLVALTGQRRIVQDTEKLPFLCEICEDIFGDLLESPFARDWFHLYPNIPVDQAPVDKTVRFYISVAWRVLRFLMDKNAIPEQSLEDAQVTELFFRDYLNNEDAPLPPWNNYLFYASDFDGVSGAPPSDLMRYSAGFGMVLFVDREFIIDLPIRPAIISIIGPFIHVLELQPSEAIVNTKPEEWEGFRLVSGRVRSPRRAPPHQLTRWLTRILCTPREDFVDDVISTTWHLTE